MLSNDKVFIFIKTNINMKKHMKHKKEMGHACCGIGHHKCAGGGYLLGFLGAAIYYVSTAGSFWIGVLGVLKSLVWPAFLVYETLKFLGV